MNNNQVEIFNFNGQYLRVFGTDEKPMFLAKEVGEILGIKNIRQLDFEPYEIRVCSIYTNRGSREATLLSESAVYKVIFKSRKEDAKIFQKWVCEEVLPSIRRTGKYELEQKLQATIQKLETSNTEIEEMKKHISNLQYLEKTKPEKHNGRIALNVRLTELVETHKLGPLDKKIAKTLMGKFVSEDGRFNYVLCDKDKFTGRLASISRRLSTKKKELYDRYPQIERNNRRNVYVESEYLNFGDKIILEYIKENPLDTWDIDWEFVRKIAYGEIEPF